MNRFSSFLAAAVFAVMATAAPALAHPKLASATPAANATVKPTKTIELHFNEKLTPAFSGASVVMTAMPGMPGHGEMKLNGAKASVAKDGTTMVITLAKPLAAGDYRIDWYAVAGDTHRIKGSHSFKVK